MIVVGWGSDGKLELEIGVMDHVRQMQGPKW